MTAVIHTRTFREVEITRRTSDGFFNATQMCRVHCNRPAAYLTSQRGSEYLEALAESLGVLKDDLVSTQNGGVQPGTWVHPRVAVDMSRWLCPTFGVWMDGWFLEELSKSTRDDPESLTPATAGRVAVHQMQLMNETDLHYRVVAYIRRFHPTAVFLAGLGELQDTEAKRLDAWAKGYMKGQPDVLLLNPTRRHCGFALELKHPGVASPQAAPQQLQTLRRLGKLGFATLVSNDYDAVCRSLDAFMAAEAFRCSCCGVLFASDRAIESHLLRKRLRDVEDQDREIPEDLA